MAHINSSLDSIIKKTGIFQRTPESIRKELESILKIDLTPIRHFLTDTVMIMVAQHYESTTFPYPFTQTMDFIPITTKTTLYKTSPELQTIIGKEIVDPNEIVALIWEYAYNKQLVVNNIIVSDENIQRLCSTRVFDPSQYDFNRHLSAFHPVSDIQKLPAAPAINKSSERYSRSKWWRCSPELATYLGINFITIKAAITKIRLNVQESNLKVGQNIIECNQYLKSLSKTNTTTFSDLHRIVRTHLKKVSRHQVSDADHINSIRFMELLNEKCSKPIGRKHSKYSDMKFVKPNTEFAKVCEIELFPRKVGLKFLWGYIRGNLSLSPELGKRTYVADAYLKSLGFPDIFQTQNVMSMLSSLVSDVNKSRVDPALMTKCKLYLDELYFKKHPDIIKHSVEHPIVEQAQEDLMQLLSE